MKVSKGLFVFIALVYFLGELIAFVRKVLNGIAIAIAIVVFVLFNAFLWILYTVAIALYAVLFIISFPTTLLIIAYIVRAFAKSQKITYVEALKIVREKGFGHFINPAKVLTLSIIIALLIYYIAYKIG